MTNHVLRCPNVDVSDARIIFRVCWESRDQAEPEEPSGNSRQALPHVRKNTNPSTCPIRAAHAEFIATLKGQGPRAIPLDVDAVDLKDRADHLNKVFNALSVYVTAILDDTAQNAPGGLDFGDVGAALSDLASDVTGTIQLTAGAMTAGRVA
jgi:hypothetical protein